MSQTVLKEKQIWNNKYKEMIKGFIYNIKRTVMYMSKDK